MLLEPDCPNPLPCSVFEQHIPHPSFTWSDAPEHSLGSPLVGQVGFAILKFPHLTGVEHLFNVELFRSEGTSSNRSCLENKSAGISFGWNRCLCLSREVCGAGDEVPGLCCVGKETEVPTWNFYTTSMSSESCWPPLKGAGYKGACGAVTCPGCGLKTGWSCNRGHCEAVSTSILPLSSIWHLDLPFASCDISSLLCSESLEIFSKRRNPRDRSETPWGAQHDPISPGRISWIWHFFNVSRARPGGFWGGSCK